MYWLLDHEPNDTHHGQLDRAELSAKVWLEREDVARNLGFRASELREILNHVRQTKPNCWRRGVAMLADAAGIRIHTARVTDDELVVALMDGRTISAPLAWFPRLFNADAAQRAAFEIAGGG